MKSQGSIANGQFPKAKLKPSRDSTKSCVQYLDPAVSGLQRGWVAAPPALSLAEAAHTPHLQLALADIQWSWHCQYPEVSIVTMTKGPGISNTMRSIATMASPSHLHTLSFQGLSAGTKILSPGAWPQLLSMAPLILHLCL